MAASEKMLIDIHSAMKPYWRSGGIAPCIL